MVVDSPVVHPLATQALRSRSPRGRAWGLSVAVAGSALVAAVVVTAVIPLKSPEYGTAVRDVAAVAAAGDPIAWYTGWVTYAGVLAWMASAAVAALAGRVVWSRGERREGGLLAGFAALSGALAVDDLLMVHESVQSVLGISEQVPMGLLALLALTWGLINARTLLADRELPLLALSLLLFAHSMFADAVGGLVLHEEGTKLAATVCWAAWAWRRSCGALLGRGGRADGADLTPREGIPSGGRRSGAS